MAASEPQLKANQAQAHPLREPSGSTGSPIAKVPPRLRTAEPSLLFEAWCAHNKPPSGDGLICEPVFVKAQHAGKLHHRAADSTVQHTHCKFDESGAVGSSS
jgi:hypothetical protein